MFAENKDHATTGYAGIFHADDLLFSNIFQEHLSLSKRPFERIRIGTFTFPAFA